MSELEIKGHHSWAEPVGWRERVKMRFDDGTYVPVPWSKEAWAQERPDHFAHISINDKTQVAYYPNPEAGERQTPVRIKPGRYLQKFYAHALTPDDINKWTGQFRTDGLMFAKSADDIERIYKGTGHGTAACMSHPKEHYRTPFHYGKHPIHAYAGSAQVAYLTQGHCITARSIVWPERKIFTRIYGDTNALRAALEREGYKAGMLDGLPLIGVNLTEYQVKRGCKEKSDSGEPYTYLLCPYVDHIKWAKWDAKANTLTLQVAATGATHSVQHGDGVSYPIEIAPSRPNAPHTRIYVDHAQMVAIERGKPLTAEELKELMARRAPQVVDRERGLDAENRPRWRPPSLAELAANVTNDRRVQQERDNETLRQFFQDRLTDLPARIPFNTRLVANCGLREGQNWLFGPHADQRLVATQFELEGVETVWITFNTPEEAERR